jgi:hypothetical protein
VNSTQSKEKHSKYKSVTMKINLTLDNSSVKPRTPNRKQKNGQKKSKKNEEKLQ